MENLLVQVTPRWIIEGIRNLRAEAGLSSDEFASLESRFGKNQLELFEYLDDKVTSPIEPSLTCVDNFSFD